MNALRSLLEQHDHIVQEIDGQNDFGEDLHVTFTEDGRFTGDVIKIQVKGGKSSRRASGYGVRVAHHSVTWANGNVPVFCVVHDPETNGLYWANATSQLLRARRERAVLRTVAISATALLDHETLADFVSSARNYLGRYRGNHAIRAQLGEMAGVEFSASDDVLHFVNDCFEDLIFWQRRGEGFATLLHSDLDWEPRRITPDMLRFGALTSELKGDELPEPLRGLAGVPTIGDVILDIAEAMWLGACFSATEWSRRPTRQSSTV
ncbi:DUF4365 domain-containing protein [Streptomyces sp. NPDC054919]